MLDGLDVDNYNDRLTEGLTEKGVREGGEGSGGKMWNNYSGWGRCGMTDGEDVDNYNDGLTKGLREKEDSGYGANRRG